MIASQAVATAPPDGYTLIMVASGHATNPLLYSKIPYDTFKDFTPVSLLASSPNILLVRAESPFKTLADVISAAKAKPGSLSFAHAGNGTSTHLAGELLKNLAKVDLAPSRTRAARPRSMICSADKIQCRSKRPGIGRPTSGRHAARARRHHGVARAVAA